MFMFGMRPYCGTIHGTRTAAAVELNSEQRQTLQRMARVRSMPARRVERARIVLLAADGLENQQIAQRMRMTPEKAARWRSCNPQDSRAKMRLTVSSSSLRGASVTVTADRA